MSMLDKRIAIAVYLPREREGTLEEFLRAGGLTPTETDEAGWIHALWPAANLITTEAKLIEQLFHRRIWITFLEGEFLEQRPHFTEDACPQEADGGMALIYALRDLCMALEPDMAMFLSNRWQDGEWLEPQEWTVMTNDAIYWVASRVGALYLNDELAAQLKNPRFAPNPDHFLAGRERIEVPKGFMILAGQGWYRFVR